MSAVQAWTSAGLPKNQLALGVCSYGHSFLVNKSVALTEQGEITVYPPFEPELPEGDSSDDPAQMYAARRPVGEASSISGD